MATDIDWPELQKVAKEKRYELHLNGAEVKKRVEKLDGELPGELYALKALNFLEVTRSGLRTLSVQISNFTQLQNLVLHNNALTTLPETLGNLKQLRFLDVSFNELESLPTSLGQITALFNLNVSHNKLSSLPVLENPSLHAVDLSYNLFTEVPLGTCNSRLATLDTLNIANNSVERVPSEIGQLVSLKTFVLDENRVRELPSELLRCTRLKEVLMRNNPLADKRLAKLVTDKTNSMKAVLDYLTVALQRNCSVKEKDSDSAGRDAQVRKEDAKALRRKQKRGASASQNDDNESGSLKHRIVITKPDASKRLDVTVGTEVLELRPYIVLCVVRNLRLTDGTTAKRFFQLQNRLHDDDSLCAQRHAATLATHDLSAVRPPLRYDAGRPEDVEVQALGRQRSAKAIDLVREMHAEAERMRKEKKRNQVTGVHKYLDLLVGRSLFAFLFDAQQTPISFPPLTNAEATRVSKDTRDVLVEVTSPTSLDVCKRVMEAFLKGLFEIGCVPSATADEAAASEAEADRCQLLIEQVRVVNATDGQLRVCYPSRTDLQFEDDDASRFEVVWKADDQEPSADAASTSTGASAEAESSN